MTVFPQLNLLNPPRLTKKHRRAQRTRPLKSSRGYQYMSSSSARLAANTANALHSTGPRTPAGAARSSQNARTHGLTARDLIVAADERQEFNDLLNDYQTDVKPEGAIQHTLFDELVGAAWNLRRVRRMEAVLCGTASCEDLLK